MAKTCLLCGESSPDEAATCANDGEATWSSEVAADRDTPVVDAPAETDETPKAKRVRK